MSVVDILLEHETPGEKVAPTKINVDIRLCKDCRATLFSRHDFDEERKRQLPIVRFYNNLVQFERGIRLLQPRFQKLLSALQ